MDDGDGGLSFDFEGGLDAAGAGASAVVVTPTYPAPSSDAPGSAANGVGPAPPHGHGRGRGSFRQTVCRHWLRGLCMKGDSCGFLHQYDKDRMPVCRFYLLHGECHELDCVYKHSDEDIKECNMYNMGFCPNGPNCRYRHVKQPGPPPPVEEVFQKLQQMNVFNYGSSNRFYQHRGTNYNQHGEKPEAQHSSVAAPGVQQVLTVNPQHVPPPPQQQQQNAQVQGAPNGSSNQATRTANPLPHGQSRYFVVKSCNRENLEISVQQGVWATQRSNEAKLNEAFESMENIILIFSINRTRHFQGCAKMTSRIGGYIGGGNWKYAHGTPHYGRNFSLQWLKLCELSFQKTHHLRNPYNDNLPVKISRDCQELEPFIGEQLASLLYLESDSELMAVLIAAETKKEEEKARGVSADEVADNQDIVLFDDDEEEEEEESEEEDDNNGQATKGRGRGRGAMWRPHMPMLRGAGSMLGMRGFPPNMMGDGFSSGDGFGMPDLFGLPRSFAPFGGLRFPGPMHGIPFPSVPPQPGGLFPMGDLGMMMGPNRGPFMGGGMPMGGLGRANRPMGMAPFMPPPPLTNSRPAKQDQRKPGSDRTEQFDTASDQGNRGQGTVENSSRTDAVEENQHSRKSQSKDRYGRSSFQDDESESDEETAPRRSRHSERKKHRGSGGDSG